MRREDSILVASDGRAYQYRLSYPAHVFAESMFIEWNVLTTDWHGEPRRDRIAVALEILAAGM